MVNPIGLQQQQRSDLAANWAVSDPVLKKGEIGYETDDLAAIKMKVGDGVTVWTSLPYWSHPNTQSKRYIIPFIGIPTDGMVVLVPIGESCTLPASASGSLGAALVAATAQTDLVVKKNAATIGTVRWAIAGTIPSFVGFSATSFVSGDNLSVTFPNPADATLANGGVNFKLDLT
jgi:hypothetical protein